MAALTLDILEVSGPPSAMGEAQGEHWREQIQAFVDMRFAAMRSYGSERGQPKLVDSLSEVARQSMDIHTAWDGPGMEEHRGIAQGAKVDSVALYAATQMTDMRDVVLLGEQAPGHDFAADAEGCTSIMVPPTYSRHGHAWAGQTWDLNPQDVDFVVGVQRRPLAGPATFSVTCAGCLTLMGGNEHGVAVGTTNLKTLGAKPGVGYLGVLHRAIRCETAAQASALVEKAPVAAAHSYWMADTQTRHEWERSPSGAYLRDAGEQPLGRSNHCLADEHARVQAEPTNSSSAARLSRVQSMLLEGQVDESRLLAIFSDRSDGVDSINRYAEDDQGTATDAVLYINLETRTVWACRGPADRGQWVRRSL
nr:hypothetical protein [Oceanococcus sp. HetDA_MAG_MS8]